MKKIAILLITLCLGAYTYAGEGDMLQQKNLSATGFIPRNNHNAHIFDWRKGAFQKKITENFVGISVNAGMVMKRQSDLNNFTFGGRVGYQHRFFNGIAVGGNIGLNYFMSKTKVDPATGGDLMIEDNAYNPFTVLTLAGSVTYYALKNSYFHPYLGIDVGVFGMLGLQDGFFKETIWEHPDANNMKLSRMGLHVAPHLGCMIEMGPDWRFTFDASVIYIPNATFTDNYQWQAGQLIYQEEITVNTGILIAPTLNVGLSYSL